MVITNLVHVDDILEGNVRQAGRDLGEMVLVKILVNFGGTVLRRI